MTVDQPAVIEAAVLTGVGTLLATRTPCPAPAAGEMLVEVLGCTLCGSDLHTFSGRRSGPLPCVLGHEIVGRVIAIGPAEKTGPRRDLNQNVIAVGDRIVWAIVASCGRCDRCRRGLPQKCLAGIKYGHVVASPGSPPRGGLATHCLLAAGTSIVRLPASLSLEAACPAGCATATVAAALEPAGDLEGRNVLIFGLGMLGLTAAAMARSRGASRVIGIDPSPQRRAVAPPFGVTRSCSPLELAGVRDGRRPDAESTDLVLEMSGAPAAVAAAIDACSVGGAVHLIGSVFPAGEVGIDPEQLVRKLLTVRGIHNYAPRHLAAAVTFLTDHAHVYPFNGLVTAWYPLARAAEAFDAAAAAKHIRVGVRPSAGASRSP